MAPRRRDGSSDRSSAGRNNYHCRPTLLKPVKTEALRSPANGGKGSSPAQIEEWVYRFLGNLAAAETNRANTSSITNRASQRLSDKKANEGRRRFRSPTPFTWGIRPETPNPDDDSLILPNDEDDDVGYMDSNLENLKILMNSAQELKGMSTKGKKSDGNRKLLKSINKYIKAGLAEGKRRAQRYVRKALTFALETGYVIPLDPDCNVLRVSPSLLADVDKAGFWGGGSKKKDKPEQPPPPPPAPPAPAPPPKPRTEPPKPEPEPQKPERRRARDKSRTRGGGQEQNTKPTKKQRRQNSKRTRSNRQSTKRAAKRTYRKRNSRVRSQNNNQGESRPDPPSATTQQQPPAPAGPTGNTGTVKKQSASTLGNNYSSKNETRSTASSGSSHDNNEANEDRKPAPFLRSRTRTGGRPRSSSQRDRSSSNSSIQRP